MKNRLTQALERFSKAMLAPLSYLSAAGLLLAARSDYIEVNGRRYPRTPVALSEQPVSDGGGYHALWGAAEERGRGHEAVDVAEAAVAQSAKAG